MSNAFFIRSNFKKMNTENFINRLQNLGSGSIAQFGIMTPQHMIEHLILTLKLSYGRVKIPEFEPNELQLAQKHALLFTDIQFPRGIKAPGMPPGLSELKFPDLEPAKADFFKTLSEYHKAYQNNPILRTPHPKFGNLTFEEWQKFHSKHIEHHLSQFGL
jgi:hypothetical protein